MNDMLLSFIVPVFNVEDFIEECLDSILVQITEECEVVIIDDGSTDSSGKICDGYQEKYSNITVLHKQNGGLSSARNEGIKKARGKYIAFVDGDDTIASGSIKKILAELKEENSEIVFMQCTKTFPDGTSKNLGDNISRNCIKGKTRSEVLEYLSTRPKFPGSACTKLFKRSFVSSIEFIEGRRNEDLYFCRDAFLNAKSFDCFEFPYYEYRQQRSGSLTSVGSENADSIMRFIADSADVLCKNRIAIDNDAKSVMSFIAYEYAIVMWKSVTTNEYIEGYSWVLDYAGAGMVKNIGSFVKVFGVKRTAKLIKIMKR